VILTPIRYRCKHCGYILFEFVKVGQDYYGVPTPEEIYRIYGGVCPRCKSMLEIPSPTEIRSRIIIRATAPLKHTLLNPLHAGPESSRIHA